MQDFQKKNRNIILISLLVLMFIFMSDQCKAFQLSEQAEISLITCAPGNNAATVYGHTAIRVRDVSHNYDLAFNYGIYDFDAPNFLYRFASGETDYLLAAYKFDAFIQGYKRGKRSIYEQVLNLSAEEKQKIFDFLIWNAKPENRVYRYNFFFDNCATRVRDVLADNIDGGLSFQEENWSRKTLRQLVDDDHGKLLWLTFGIDFVVSSKSDRVATFYEEMFLPDYLMSHFQDAIKIKENIPLIKHSHAIYEAPVSEFKSLKFISPFIVFSILTLLIIWFSFKQFKTGQMKLRLDYWVYGFNGFVGVVIAWFALFSEHPAMSPNYNLLWAVPLNFVFVLALIVKKWRSGLEYYHVFISVCMLLFICLNVFLPQQFHPVYYLLVLMVLSRALFHSLLLFKELRKKMNRTL